MNLFSIKQSIVACINEEDRALQEHIKRAQERYGKMYEVALQTIHDSEHTLEEKLKAAFELGLHRSNPLDPNQNIDPSTLIQKASDNVI